MDEKRFVVGCLLIMVTCLALGAWSHEELHVINNSKTGLVSRVEFSLYNSWLPAVATYKDGNMKRDLTNLELANSFNEAVNYNIIPVALMLVAVMSLGFIYLGSKLGGTKLKNNDWDVVMPDDLAHGRP